MNDESLKDFSVLAISEPYAWTNNNTVITAPMRHPNWTKIVPTVKRTERWAFRSMLWIRKDIEAEQLPVESSDLTAAVLQLSDRSILVVSVYIESSNTAALPDAINKLNQLIQRARNGTSKRLDIILAGDFNRHDQQWGGDNVSPERQGEADPIIDLMNEHSLESLLPRGTTTWQRGDLESTIDLMLASDELAISVIKCTIHTTEHGSDHRAIETAFDVATPERRWSG
jgi:exonuclease III